MKVLPAAVIVHDRWLHSESNLHDGKLGQKTRLGQLKTIRGYARAVKIDFRQRRQFLPVTRDHIAQVPAALKRKFTVTEDIYFESIQHLGCCQQLVELGNTQLEHIKAALRINRSKRVGNLELILKLFEVRGSPANQSACIFEKSQRQFRVVLLHGSGQLDQI